ncbi:hypothetical protein [Halobaculum magnesiiphilum]|uniref:Uncharacterized protein n=1 Tax=Halobaculum magnesiiphilum TaxID=1017351 RepID=A0A8T8WBE6_9EURY|nr:hypothetical protein [Halobaculum magnesiiphilum]QZP37168.1 hypothetical protein K6T50_12860 [Halobaculum magnesiiphilum]
MVDADSGPELDADSGPERDGDSAPEADDWYRWGRIVLYAEMALAVLITAFSLYLAFTGRAGFIA